MPATRAALYAVKLTHAQHRLQGVIPTSVALDCVGAMAKCPRDIANMLDILCVEKTKPGPPTYTSFLGSGWSDLRVGVLDPKDWPWPNYLAKLDPGAQAQINEEVSAAYSKISGLAQAFTAVSLPKTAVFDSAGELAPFVVMKADFRRDLNDYLAELQDAPVRTLKEIIQFNYDHSEQELADGYEDQSLLLQAQRNAMDPAKRDELLRRIQHQSRDGGIDKALDENNIDVILCAADSEINVYTCCSGYPSAHMPLSYLKYNGRPFGIIAITRAHAESALVKVMSAWENTFPARLPPRSLL